MQTSSSPHFSTRSKVSNFPPFKISFGSLRFLFGFGLGLAFTYFFFGFPFTFFFLSSFFFFGLPFPFFFLLSSVADKIVFLLFELSYKTLFCNL